MAAGTQYGRPPLRDLVQEELKLTRSQWEERPAGPSKPHDNGLEGQYLEIDCLVGPYTQPSTAIVHCIINFVLIRYSNKLIFIKEIIAHGIVRLTEIALHSETVVWCSVG